MVVVGGTSGLPSLTEANATKAFRAASNTGFYLHYSATDQLFAPSLPSIAKVFSGKPAVVEVGAEFGTQFWAGAWRANVLRYGISPRVALVNFELPSVDAATASSQSIVAQFEAFTNAGKTAGVAILAPVVSPNSTGGGGCEGDAKTLAIKHPWADRWWDNFRRMAEVGGGIAVDAPPAFFLRGLPSQAQIKAYQAFTIAELRWAAEHHLWSAYIVSPYFDAISFGSDSEKLYRILLAADALPETWVVENYSLCGPPFPRACTAADAAYRAPVGQEDEPNTEASVALWLAKHAARRKLPGEAVRP